MNNSPKNNILNIKKNLKYKYGLLENAFSKSDLHEGIKVLKSGFITMGENTRLFEKEFAKKVNANFAVMVNSGSSANLLSVFAAGNILRKNKFKFGDEVLIPVLCWSTSLWPLIQAGLKPIFVDINPETLNVNADVFISKITKKTKVIMLVNVLGACENIKKITSFAKKKKIIIIVDNCESLGAKYENKELGTYGDFGTYSFFCSHQITSGEGGMVVCNNKEDYKILLALRSHGWSRSYNENYISYAKKNSKLDPRYIFFNSGFNLRPTDIQAAIARSQLKRLNNFIKIRADNKKLIINALLNDKKWKNQFKFVHIDSKVDPSYMVLPIFLNEDFSKKKKLFIDKIEKIGLETRPVISGNFINQPGAKLYKLNPKNLKYKGAQQVEDSGFVIGLHTKRVSNEKINFIVRALFSIDSL
jgi:CDP-6-deoxy-D-xylo-4-hexulose-3-dehydrase